LSAGESSFVLVVDDEPDLVNLDPSLGFDLEVKHPTELTEELLDKADLVLVDHSLTNWDRGQDVPYGCCPDDGVALAGIMRAHLRTLKDTSPAAVALYSGALNELTLEQDPQEHLVAMSFGLEWAFSKVQRKNAPDLSYQVKVLADAVHALPREWSEDDTDKLADQVKGLLGLGQASFAGSAFAEIERCRPPMHHLSEWTSGLAMIRWLLHRILPYPACLHAEGQLAIRMRVDPAWLREQLTPGARLRDALSSAMYSGALAGFLGDRWWWPGCAQLIRDALKGPTKSIHQLHEWLTTASGTTVARLEVDQPVLVYNDAGAYLGVHPLANCARIQPDNWPTFAEEAWCLRAEARRVPELRRLVVTSDLDLIDGTES
jgi:hypothetical protein